MTRPSVTVTMAQWGKTDLTVRAVEALARSEYDGDIEILVYDNASPGGPGGVIHHPDVKVVLGEENVGFGAAHNHLAALGSGRLLLILNNDTIVAPTAISRLVTRMEDSGVGAVTPLYRDFTGVTLEMGGFLGPAADGWQLFRGQRPPRSLRSLPYQCDYGSGAALLLDRTWFVDRGGFDDVFAPAYYEDTDLCFALATEGKSVVVEPTAVVYHYEGATAGRDLSTGLKRYQVVNRTKFVERWAERLATRPPLGFGSALERALFPDVDEKVLWISPHLPRPDREAGHARIVSMIAALRAHRIGVALWAEHLIDADWYGPQLESRGIPWFGHNLATRWPLDDPGVTPRTVQALLELIDWDAVIISFPDVAQRFTPVVRKLRPRAAVLIDNVDVHFVRRLRGIESGVETMADIDRLKSWELGVYRHGDGVITASEVESELIAGEIPGLPVFTYVSVAADGMPGGIGEPASDGSLTFLGNFHHPPNTDAVEWWLSSIGGLVTDTNGEPIPLRVVGSGSEVLASAWESRGPLHVAGWVEDLASEFSRCRVFAAPLRYGAGTKGKLVTALRHGVPVVTTSVGAEGFDPAVTSALRIADDATAFARAVVELMTDDEAWTEAVGATRRAVGAIEISERVQAAELADWLRRRCR